MNEEKRKQYQLLKEKNKETVRELNWKNNVLFLECMDALEGCRMLSLADTDVLCDIISNSIPITQHGCIDWKNISDTRSIHDINDIHRIFDASQEYYIIWDMQDTPCLCCKLTTILENIDDVLAVASDTWLLSKNKKEVIQFYHEGKIFYGELNNGILTD